MLPFKSRGLHGATWVYIHLDEGIFEGAKPTTALSRFRSMSKAVYYSSEGDTPINRKM